MWNLKTNDTNELIYKTETDSQPQRRNLWFPSRRESQGVWDGHVHTAIFKVGNQQEPMYSTGNSAQCYEAVWVRGEFGENGYMYM